MEPEDSDPLKGERWLLRRLLDLSVEDYRRNRWDASAWFFAPIDAPAGVLSFEDVCFHLGFDSDHLRRLLPKARPSVNRRTMTQGRKPRSKKHRPSS